MSDHRKRVSCNVESCAYNDKDHSCNADKIDVNRTCASPDCCDETECATFKAKD